MVILVFLCSNRVKMTCCGASSLSSSLSKDPFASIGLRPLGHVRTWTPLQRSVDRAVRDLVLLVPARPLSSCVASRPPCPVPRRSPSWAHELQLSSMDHRLRRRGVRGRGRTGRSGVECDGSQTAQGDAGGADGADAGGDGSARPLPAPGRTHSNLDSARAQRNPFEVAFDVTGPRLPLWMSLSRRRRRRRCRRDIDVHDGRRRRLTTLTGADGGRWNDSKLPPMWMWRWSWS